jgi:hypothetical protein
MLLPRLALFLSALVPALRPLAQLPPRDDPFLTLLEGVRAQAKLPALGCALVTTDGGLEGVWVTGTRRAGGEERVTADDRWHLGSPGTRRSATSCRTWPRR